MKYDLSKPFDINKAKSRFQKLVEKRAKIEIKEYKALRSLSQNSYWHLACGILGDYAGYTIDEMKIILKDQLDFMTYEKNGHKFYKSSAELDTAEFTKLVDFTRAFGDQHGCYIPTPDEMTTQRFEVEQSIQHL